MTDIAHSALTGSNLHEPKGASSATIGQVYVANGAGSGAWTNISSTSFTGMIADFVAPVVPTGWLECDGSDVSTTTYAALFAVTSISQSGTRVNGSPIIGSLASTTGIKAGYYIFGTGIAAGTTVLTVDSSIQITLSANASSTGTSTVYVSPWYLASGTFRLPDLTTAGKYRRSRTATVQAGTVQTDQNKAHTHTGVTGTESSNHAHVYSGTTSSENTDHSHNIGLFDGTDAFGHGAGGVTPTGNGGGRTGTTGGINSAHQHTYSGTSGLQNLNHTHTISSDGGTEVRPTSVVFLTCVKT